MALLHFGICHSNCVSGRSAVFGRLILTLCPVDSMYPMCTRLLSAVDHRRAIGPPPVSSGRYSPEFLSYQRGDITHVYLLGKSRFWGFGIVVWFHGWRMSTGFPSGSFSTNFSPPLAQSW